MQLNNSWNSKTIQKQLLETRTKYSDLYRGEKYLISKFIKNNDSVLDIGCGAADYLTAVGKMGAEFVGGQDLDKEAILRGKTGPSL